MNNNWLTHDGKKSSKKQVNASYKLGAAAKKPPPKVQKKKKKVAAVKKKKSVPAKRATKTKTKTETNTVRKKARKVLRTPPYFLNLHEQYWVCVDYYSIVGAIILKREEPGLFFDQSLRFLVSVCRAGGGGRTFFF